MRKSIARKLALLLALILLTTTFGSDYNSIGVRASEAEGFEEQDVSTDTLSSDYSDADFWEPQDEEIQEEEPATEEPEEENIEEGEPGSEEEIQEEDPQVEEPSETPEEGNVEEPTETPSEDMEPSGEETPTEEPNPDEGTPSDEELPEEPATEEPAAEEAPAEEPQGIVITYAAGEGGTVSVESETVTTEAAGSTAIPDEGFEFDKWTAEDGGTICPDITFIPTGEQIHENAVYTAVFKAIEEEEPEVPMPEVTFDGEAENKVKVHVEAPEGAFPKGTKMVVSPVYDQEILEAAAEAVNGEASRANAVDISFIYEEKEIEPLIPIKVKLYHDEIKTEDETAVVHIEDDGDAKVVENTEVSEKEVEFESDDFSVYVVVPVDDPNCRLVVKFYKVKDGEPIATMYVKKDDNMEQVIYDPGVDKEDDESFMGWNKNPDYADDAEGISIEKVREELTTMLNDEDGVADGTEVNYYSVLKKHYEITYLDTNDVSLGQHTIVYRADTPADQLSREYTVKMAYTPEDNYHRFEGWNVTEDTVENIVTVAGNAYDGKPIDNDTTITVKGDVTFKVNAPEGRWLIFNENGKGGKYNAPQFVKSYETTHRPCLNSEMTRYGYTFDDWYLPERVYQQGDEIPTGYKVGDAVRDEDGNVILGEKFVFEQHLEENTTIYAKWNSKNTASYTYIIWKQRLDDPEKYDLVASKVIENGTVGEDIPYTFVNDGDQDYVTVGPRNNRTEYRYTGFCFKEPTEPVKITTEGDAVLNLYFDRITYNLKFYMYRRNGNQYTCGDNSGTGGNNNIWGGLVTTYTASTAPTYNGPLSQGDDNNGHYFVITAKYGENIASRWPTYEQINGTGSGREPVSFVMMVGTKLKPSATNQGSGTVKGTVNTLNENILGATNNKDGNFLVVRFNRYNNWRYHVWYEVVDGVDTTGKETHDYNGKTYYKDHIVESRSSNTEVSSQNPSKFFGFSDPVKLGQNWRNSNYWNETEQTSDGQITTYNLNFVYDREKFSIQFMDGAYYKDGNDAALESHSDQLLHESRLIEQGMTIPTDEDAAGYEPASKDGYVFAGWYTDEACRQLYTFTTMPIGGVKVYAKWILKQYRVFLHPNAYIIDGDTKTKDTSLDWGSTNQKMTFRIDYGAKVSAPNGTRDNYTFVGWYKDPDCTDPFNADAFVLNDETVTQEYDKTKPTDDSIDKWGEGGTTNDDVNRFWITRELNIYGMWREKITGAKGIDVVYDPVDPEVTDPANPDAAAVSVEGQGNAVDNNKYVDNAKATAAPALKADGYTFTNWVMQKWVGDENSGSFVDVEGSVIFPGQKYTVLKSNAQVSDVVKDDEGNITSAKYTIHLRAEFKKNEEETPTYIPWFANDGHEAFHIDTVGEGQTADDSTLKINEAVAIQGVPTRQDNAQGFEFKGWARVEMGNTPEDAKTFMTTEGNYTQGNLTLFLYYKNGKFYKDEACTKEAEEVAADEDTPYHAMFAVWEKLCTVTYTDGVDDEEVFADDVHNVKAGETTPLFQNTGNEPTRKGYKFLGWKDENKTEIGVAETVEDDVTYVAQWEALTYNVKYTASGNGKVDPTDNEDMSVLSADDVTGSTATPDAGYKLVSWKKKDATSTITADDELTKKNATDNLNTNDDGTYKDTEYVATFDVDEGNTYTVTFEAEEGGSVNPTSDGPHQVLSNADVQGSTATPDDGYEFAGWYKGDSLIGSDQQLSDDASKNNLNKDENNTSSVTGEKYTTYKNTTYTAKFVKKYKVTYTANGNGSVTNDKDENISPSGTDGITGSEAKADKGYKFVEWKNKADANKKDADHAKLTKTEVAPLLSKSGDLYIDTELEAVFDVNDDDTYTVTYEAEDGGSVTPTTGGTIQILTTEGIAGSTAEAAQGYAFVGWFKGTTPICEEASISADIAKQYLNKNTENVGSDGNKYTTYDDTTYTAKFIPLYTVSYKVDGEGGDISNKEDETARADGIVGITGSIASVDNEGYEFLGWFKDNASAPCVTDLELTPALIQQNLNKNDDTGYFEDTTFTAKFAVNTNKTYNVNYSVSTAAGKGNGSVSNRKDEGIQVLGTEGIEGSEAKPDNGYKFVQWTNSVDATKKDDQNAKITVSEVEPMLNKDGELYADTDLVAEFTVDEKATYTIKYEAVGKGSVNPKEETWQILDASKIAGSTATAGENSAFVGWYKGNTEITTEAVLTKDDIVDYLNKKTDNVSSVDGTNYTTYEDTTFTAKFLPTYTITYKAVADDGTRTEIGGDVTNKTDADIRSDGIVGVSGSTAELKNQGYKFLGWFEVGANKAFYEGTELTAAILETKLNTDEETGLYEDTTFEARFAINDDKTYKVEYDAEGNGSVSSKLDKDIQVLGTDGINGSTATPDKGYRFVGWKKDGEEQTFTISATLTATLMENKLNKDNAGLYEDTKFIAVFEVKDDETYTVSYAAGEGGSVDPETGGTIQILTTEGIVVSTATAAEGYEFEGWYKGTTRISTDATIALDDVVANLNKKTDNVGSDGKTYTTYEDTTYTAKFIPLYTVSYKVEGEGGDISNKNDETARGDGTDGITGSTASLENAGYKFLGWYKDNAQTAFTTELTLTTDLLKDYLNKDTTTGYYQNTTFTAKFAINDDETYDVNYSVSTAAGKGNGKVDPLKDEKIQVLGTDGIEGSTATPDKGYKFVQWTNKDDADKKDADNSTITVTEVEPMLNKDGDLYADTELVAEFAINDDDTYTITYEVDGNGGVNPESETHQILDASKIAGSTATAGENAAFLGWYKGNTEITTEAVLTKDDIVDYLNKKTDNVSSVDGTNYTTYEDTTFTARFLPTYTITYKAVADDANRTEIGGSVTNDSDADIRADGIVNVTGSTASVLNQGYKFLGWFTVGSNQAFYTGTELTPEILQSQLNTDNDGLYVDTTFEARFGINGDKTYKVEYEAEGNGSVSNKLDKDIQVLGTEGITGSKATADNGYVFIGWKKAGASETFTDSAELTLDPIKDKLNTDTEGLYTDTKFIAVFAINNDDTYTVSYEAGEGGSVNPTEEGPFQILTTEGIAGSTAEATQGYAFAGWYKEQGTEAISTDAVLSDDDVIANLNKKEDNVSSIDGSNYTTYDDTTFIAKFIPLYTVSYKAEGDGGSITNSDDETARGDGIVGITGSTAQLKNAGYKFLGWFKDSETEPCVTELELTPSLIEDNLNKNADTGYYADTIFTAKFEIDVENTYEVQYLVSEEEGKGNGSVTSAKDEQIQVLGTEGINGSEAKPDNGYKFVQWTNKDDATKKDDQNAKITVSEVEPMLNKDGELYADTDLVAEFAVDDGLEYTITYDYVGNGSVTPTSEKHQILDASKVAGSTATAGEKAAFVGWYKGNDLISEAAVLSKGDIVANLNKKEDNVSSVDGENYTTYENTTFTAKFLPTYDVKYEAALVEYDGAMVTGGSVTSDKDENIRSDGTVNINGSTAETKNIGFKFIGWYNGETEVTTEETLTADLMKDYLNKNAEDSNLYADTTFTAKFAVNDDETYDVHYVVANDPEDPAKGHGVVNPKINENIQVLGTKGVTGSVATPDKGYRFVAWYKLEIDATETTRGIAVNRVPVDFTIDEDGNGILSEETAVKYVNTDGEIFYNTTFEAEFAVDDDNVYDVFYIAEPGGKAEPTENKGIQILSNAEVTGSVATPDEGYEFLGWYVEGKDEPITTDLTLTEENAQVNIKSSENPDSSAFEDTSEPTYITYETTKFYARFAAKIYNVTFEYRIADGVEKPANWDALVSELATHNKKVAFGGTIACPELPTVDGYTFSIWSMEEVKTESLTSKLLGGIGDVFKALTGVITTRAASQTFTMPASDVVIYSIVTKNTTIVDVPDEPGGKLPESTGRLYVEPQNNGGGGNPEVAGVNRPAEESAVLGEKREAEEEGVLGARRGGTDDATDSSRVFVLLLAAGAMATLLASKKRRYEK